MGSRSRSQSRCCSCMKNGKCIRCQCVKKGLPCVDCWPSLSNPSRCENTGNLIVNEDITRPVTSERTSENEPHCGMSSQSPSTRLSSSVVDIVSPVDSCESFPPPADVGTCGTIADEVTPGDFSSIIQQTQSLLSQPRKMLKSRNTPTI